MSSAMEVVSVFLTGLLAGEEVLVRYGLRDAMAALAPEPQLQLRQGLIRRLRILVPATFMPVVAMSLARLVLGSPPESALGWCGMAALLGFMLIAFLGTVPINKAILDWRADSLPADWQVLVRRWERLDTARCWAALCAFGCFLASLQSP